MNDLLTVSPSPHIKGKATTKTIMRDVIIALMPAVIASVILFGIYALLQIVISVSFAVLGEYFFNKITKRKQTVGDLSAIVTGIILACSLPCDMPYWQTALGAVIATVIIKGFFGGIGQNFANPAATARVVLLLAFTSNAAKATYPLGYKLVSSATPLSEDASALPSLLDMFLGNRGGALGEGCIIAILLGFVYLLIRRVISWHTTVSFVGTVFVLSLISNGFDFVLSLYGILSGGLLFGAVFMATDYATTPRNYSGKIIFGVGCGLITSAIRIFGSYPEGVSYALLLMNILTPYIEKWTVRKPFGASVKAGKAVNK